MVTIRDVVEAKKKQLEKYLRAAKQEETKRGFSVLLHELDSVKNRDQLHAKIAQVKKLLTRSKKAHTKKLFGTLLRELEDIRKHTRGASAPVRRPPAKESSKKSVAKKTASPKTPANPAKKEAEKEDPVARELGIHSEEQEDEEKTGLKKKFALPTIDDVLEDTQDPEKHIVAVPTPKHPIRLKRRFGLKPGSSTTFSKFLQGLLNKKGEEEEKDSPVIQTDGDTQHIDANEQWRPQIFHESKNKLDEFFESGFHKREEHSIAKNESFLEKVKGFITDLYHDLMDDGVQGDANQSAQKKYEEEELLRFDQSALKKMDVESHFSLSYLKTLGKQLWTIQKNKSFIDDESEISLSTVQLENIRRKATKLYGSDVALEDFMDKENQLVFLSKSGRKSQFKIYEASILGLYANQLCRRISFYLLKNFPSFFKGLYTSLRLANLKILSNTYVNILVLVVISTFFISFLLFSFVFMFSHPIFIAIPRAFVASMISSGITFGSMYAYPFAKAREREMSIKTNLPFAIANMAAVSSAGVPPTKMFKLIVESKEYGEFSTEIQKIVEYMDLFGYDLITAIRTVNAVSPSPDLKEFFEGMINTVESGGDLTRFLEQKSTESLQSYELERKKYTESVATYSDIYTGILIAAPLFFVSALSLVSLLGGTVGNIKIQTLVTMGTYVAIPLMNVGFLVFLQMSQPEI